MKLMSLPISVHLAESLYELGVRFDSVFYHYQEKIQDDPTLFSSDGYKPIPVWKTHIGRPSLENKNVLKEIAAFTSNELGEMLPYCIFFNKEEYYLAFERCFEDDKRRWNYFYQTLGNKTLFVPDWQKTEGDARAMLLISILEKGYIDVSQTIIK